MLRHQSARPGRFVCSDVPKEWHESFYRFGESDRLGDRTGGRGEVWWVWGVCEERSRLCGPREDVSSERERQRDGPLGRDGEEGRSGKGIDHRVGSPRRAYGGEGPSEDTTGLTHRGEET